MLAAALNQHTLAEDVAERRHGDVAVWGGPSRLFYHGVRELKDGHHEILGPVRINLTFRRAL